MKHKQVNAVMLGLVWMSSLGVVFVLGILSAFAFHLGPGAGEGAASDLTLEQRELMLVLERYTGESADIATIMSVASSDDLPEQVEQALRAIMRNPDRSERGRDASRLARGLPSRKVMAAIKFVQELPANPGRNQVLGSFLESWAGEDGRRAMAFAASLGSAPERQLAIRAALRGWGRGQPADAWAWVIEQAGTSNRAERWLEIIVSNISAADTATAFRLLEQMPDSGFRDRMAGVVMGQILQTLTPREAMTWLSEFPPSSSPYAATRLAANWAVYEPGAAAQWLHRSFPSQVNGLGPVIREWVYLNPEGAADWVWSNFSGDDRRLLMDVVAEEWIGNDGPAPVAGWLNDNGPDETLDDAIGRLAIRTADVDPATALVWAQSIYDPDQRSMLEIMIGRRWIRTDPVNAAAGLPLLLESESARAALLEPVGEAYYLEEDTGIIAEEMPLEEPAVPVQ
jgi:hypothetical protein